MSRIVVTGASGFIGRQLCETLLRRGDQVVAAVRSGNALIPAGVERRNTGDLRVRADLQDVLQGADALVHLAARAHVMRESASDPERAFFEANLEVTRHLAQQAAAAAVRRFVFLSSVKVNGERTLERPFTEADTPGPEDAYGRSKWAAEQALFEIAAESGLEIVVLRPPLVYGPGVKANFLRLLKLVAREVPLPLAGVQNKRSLVSVWNLCDLMALCLHHPAAAGETFLVSDQEDLSTPELIHILADALRRRPRMFPFPRSLLQGLAAWFGQGGAAERLLGSLQVSSEKATKRLDWSPPLRVRDGIARTADWFLKNG
jgi:nucleoside-diphosphate-sugar epimerase